MSFNLSLLPPDEKNKIELDKQASFLVWKLKEAKSGPEAIEEQLSKINDAGEKVFFQQAVDKYKRVMGVA
ncbi:MULTISPECIES: DUF3283 family protein [Vibrio]|jgi:hypothetical protein|uniref:DUF3283 family protein n=1 Tax=Vibrio jasicida TaxID=766224 RepID=A0AAU9R010_9VIBR|nr:MULTISPECIES: DUF3283 family protein [Vibrio]KIP75670.1 pyridoxamine 5-phosphate oxidase [Vibrio harveyi]KIP76478.1 pyridoxamine 5-phosphate oxidase [Vibrio harveyi]MCF6454177.1 DUF3283 family protein [Vibrio sp. MMG023]MCX2792200.1 DUF3283 family protein [Vibrio sp. Sgm 5]NOJ18527.1 DUF3283 family protein [Vibrio jasicida]